MQMPSFIKETLRHANARPAWGLAFLATLLLPFMLIYARAGIEICCIVIGVSFLYQSARTGQWRWLRAPFTLACAVAWFWLIGVVTPLALNPKAGLMEAFVWIRLPLMFAALRYWVLADAKARTTLGVVLGIMLAFIAIDCYWQFATGLSLSGHGRLLHNRLTGPFDGPKVGAYLGLFTIPVIALCLRAALVKQHTRGMVLSLGLLVMVFAAIVMSGERSAFLTFLLACGTAMGLLMMAEKRLRLAGFMAAAAVVGIVAVLYATDATVQSRGQQMLATMENYWQSDYGQLASVGIDIGKQHLLHGVGLHGYRELCPTLYFEGKEFTGLHPHNYYIEWFAEAGLPGLLLLLAMLAVLLRETLQQLLRVNGMARLVPALALGAMVQHFFPLVGMQSFFTNWGAMLQWYTLALMFAVLPANDAPSPATRRS